MKHKSPIISLLLISVILSGTLACTFTIRSQNPLPTGIVLDETSAAVNTPTHTPLVLLQTPLATYTPIPSNTPPPSTTATPAPVLRRLTTGGCCVEPFFSPDGERILFIDKPNADAPTGLWYTDREANLPQFYTDKLGVFSADLSLRAFPQNGTTIVERLADGTRWTIPNSGRPVSFSPDGTQLAWTGGQSGPPFDTALREIWLSNIDGSQARQLIRLYGGGFAGWLADGNILVSGRVEFNGSDGLWTVTTDGIAANLVESERIRSESISPGGSWVIYQQLFSADPGNNGIFAVKTDGSRRFQIPLFGAYRWRDDSRLLLIPLEMDATDHRVIQINLEDGSQCTITDPLATGFKVANGDWTVSPGGNAIAFVSAEDHNIWMMTIPPNLCRG
jgi:hypothetical protein